jgi:HD-GYP domain-containing protein (c-di-GMP phosphodiesterase class II)
LVISIRVASIVHDIGKIHVPAEILNKPVSLSDIEMALVKTHCQAGYEILKTIEFPWDVAEMVLQHHERINGSGYPRGLTGDKMLLESKILAVADVVEAMVSHRPYRAAHSIDKALEEISRNRGVLFDTRVVDACLRLFGRGFQFE